MNPQRRKALLEFSDQIVEELEQLRLRDAKERSHLSGEMTSDLFRLWLLTDYHIEPPTTLGDAHNWVFEVQGEALLLVNEEAA